MHDLSKTFIRSMLFSTHRQNDVSKLLEVTALVGARWMLLEERNYDLGQISLPRYCIGHHVAARTLGCDSSTSEEVTQPLENLEVVAMLIDLEHGSNHASTAVPDRRMGPDAYAEATFSINESDYIVRMQ